MAVADTLKYDNEILRGYITWSGILLVKLLLMSFLTGINRIRKGVRKLFLFLLPNLLQNLISRHTKTQKIFVDEKMLN